MPIYEYRCEDCGKVCDFFEKNLKLKYKHKCPDCGSARLRKLLSSFTAGKKNQGTSETNSCITGTCPIS